MTPAPAGVVRCRLQLGGWPDATVIMKQYRRRGASDQPQAQNGASGFAVAQDTSCPVVMTRLQTQLLGLQRQLHTSEGHDPVAEEENS